MLEVRLGPLRLSNPVMVASGTFGFGEEYAEFFDVGKLGAVVTKGVSLEPRSGNPAPRVCETPAGMLNSVGLENPGVDVFVKQKLPLLRRRAAAVVVNIFADSAGGFATLAGLLDGAEGIDALEVNISCPNVKSGGYAFGARPDTAAEVTRAVRRPTSLPVSVKLSPNVTDIVEIARAVKDAGADVLTLVNTLRGIAIDIRKAKPVLGAGIGGLSGPAIRPVAVRAVYETYRAVKIPIIGCGGVCDWRDAVEFIMAGASAVQVGSANFRNPRAALEVLQGLEKFLTQEGKTVDQIVGLAHREERSGHR